MKSDIDFGDGFSYDNPQMNMDIIRALVALAPCPIVHGGGQLEGDPCFARGKLSEMIDSGCSFYLPVTKPRKEYRMWLKREQDVILMSPSHLRPVIFPDMVYFLTLAHEIGHALDLHKRHPAQKLFKSPRSRYRDELAAVSFSITIASQIGEDSPLKISWRKEESFYLFKYKRNNHPYLAEVLDIMPDNILNI